ncbi:MAG: hypothetical protein KAT04_06070 [Methylococcales bacterium]|nr:hypothetical protein [Methylococcales bacterium]
MSTLLFSLRGVPEDEADEIRILLDKHSIDYYETCAGNWGISMPALWLRNKLELATAQNLLNEYHQQRAITQREIYKQLKKDKKILGEKPFKRFIYLAIIIFILYLYIKMLFEFGL